MICAFYEASEIYSGTILVDGCMQAINKIFILIMLPIFAFMALRPVMPVVSDLIAHTFYNLEHNRNAHHGKHNHLHMELRKMHEKSEQQQNNMLQWSIEKWQFITHNFDIQLRSDIKASHLDPVFQATTIDDNYSFSIDHPPKNLWNY